MAADKARLYIRYPVSSIILYNGCTILHFLLGGIGIVVGYKSPSWAGNTFGTLYLVFAFVEMYVLMPFTVCPNCVYYRAKDSRCISGLNLVSQRIAKEGEPQEFPRRAQGLLCNNNLYMVALLLPILAMIPALVLNFSWLLLLVFFAVVGLLLFRFFVVFPRIACVRCSAKHLCPQARAMGVREL